MFTGIWAYAIGGLALFIAGTATGGYAVSVYKNSQINGMKAEQALEDKARANAELKQFQDISRQINTAAQDFLKNQTNFGTQIDTITKDLKDVQVKTPLPANCKPGAARMHNLAAAIAAANTRAGY